PAPRPRGAAPVGARAHHRVLAARAGGRRPGLLRRRRSHRREGVPTVTHGIAPAGTDAHHAGTVDLGTLDLGDLGFDRGAHLLVGRALRSAPPGARLTVVGRDPALPVHLAAWARGQGHRVEAAGVLVVGTATIDRWR